MSRTLRSRSGDIVAPGAANLWTIHRSRPSTAKTRPRLRGLMQSIAQAGPGIIAKRPGARMTEVWACSTAASPCKTAPIARRTFEWAPSQPTT